MSRERWGTFSVRDHLRGRAFVAEVLLYDRLVIPYPPTEEKRSKWTKEGWAPDQLDRKLEILGEERVLRAPWSEHAEGYFKTRLQAAEGANFDGRNVVGEHQSPDPFHMTRMILAQDCRPKLPYGVTQVWALAAYPSLDLYREDAGKAEKEIKEKKQARRQELALVLKHQFPVPDDSELSDDDMLRKALELAQNDDFREKRAKLNRWQEYIIENDVPPNKAVEEMEVYLQQYNEAVTRASRDVYWKCAFMAIPVAVGLVTAGLGAPLVVATGSGLVSVAAFMQFDRRPNINAGECGTAALIHDMQSKFLPSYERF